ncbi:MAG: 3-hydroxyisobutyrate dehydrogenase [Gammaproteobacteria bacterium]
MARIGFIGLGHMGQPMALNLLRAGHQLTVYDLQPAAMATLEQAGAQCAATSDEVAHQADAVITMLQTGQQVSNVCLGTESANDGLFSRANPSTLFIDCSSIDVATARVLHQRAQQASCHMVDAPVSGGVTGAEQATLTIMVGGTEQAVALAQPYLSAMGKTIVHAGIAGTGQVAKICNNMMLGISMIAVSEAFNLGEKLGLAPEKLFEISANASGQCWAMTSYCPVPGLVPSAPSNRDYQPGFTADMMLKDLRLSQNAAQTANSPTPLGAVATMLYNLFTVEGSGQQDFSAIINMIKGKISN